MTAQFNEITFSDKDIANPDDFIPAGEYNPHNVRPWLLHDHGFVLAVVFASNEQDALDEAVDRDKLDSFMLDDKDPSTRADYMKETTEKWGFEFDGKRWDWIDSVAFLGNASEPFDLESVGMLELPNPAFSFCKLFND